MFRILVEFSNTREAEAAIRAVTALREGSDTNAEPAGETALKALAKKLTDSLAYPDNDGIKEVVVRTLYEQPNDEWLSYSAMVSAVEKSGIIPSGQAESRTPAALRDLSWQVKQKVDASDLSGKQKAIEVLAERVRAGGTHQYRLTAAGRLAVGAWLNS